MTISSQNICLPHFSSWLPESIILSVNDHIAVLLLDVALPCLDLLRAGSFRTCYADLGAEAMDHLSFKHMGLQNLFCLMFLCEACFFELHRV